MTKHIFVAQSDTPVDAQILQTIPLKQVVILNSYLAYMLHPLSSSIPLYV